MDTNRTWEYFGKTDPYFGVLTQAEFTSERITEDGRRRFFELGERYIEDVMHVVHEHLDASFRPTRALDFGCGVGRLTLPLARICDAVVGMDISDGMLAEARANVARSNLTNATFVRSDDELSALDGSVDFLNSLIVFQHIPPVRGEAIFVNMLTRLREGGVGAVQFPYSFATGTPPVRKLLVEAYKSVPLLWNVRNVAKRRPFGEPMMQMNEYDLNRLLRRLQEHGCHNLHVRFTETGSFGHSLYGVILFFQKKALDPRAHA